MQLSAALARTNLNWTQSTSLRRAIDWSLKRLCAYCAIWVLQALKIMTTASIIIRSKDEADRLRLTLTSLAGQTETAELIVVNDGSTDHTEWTLAEAAKVIPLAAIHHESAKGRSAAANAGAARAKGDILIFLDGDTLAAPDFVACHLNAHSGPTRAIARGETFHLRGTRFFWDPEAGTPKPGEE